MNFAAGSNMPGGRLTVDLQWYEEWYEEWQKRHRVVAGTQKVRAVFAWSELRERVAQEEAETLRIGLGHPVVLLEATVQAVDVSFYRGRKPPTSFPLRGPIVSLDQLRREADGERPSIGPGPMPACPRMSQSPDLRRRNATRLRQLPRLVKKKHGM